MKCVCGYEYETIEGEPRKTIFGLHSDTIAVKGDEPFIEIKVGNTYLYRKPSGTVHLIACPKCRTVKLS